MRAKTVTIFLFTFAIFVGLLVWRVDDLFFGDKLNWSEAGSRAQMSLIISSLEGQVQNLKDMFIVSYPKIATDGKDFSSSEPYSVFQAMMTASPTQSSEGADWRFSGVTYQAKSPVRAWATSYIGLTLKSVKPADVKPGSVNLYSLLDPERKPYLLMLIHSGDAAGAGAGASSQASWMVGLLGPEVFQKLMDRQKGQLSQVYLVNLQAQALGHTVPEYVGSLLSEDPLVANLIKAGSSSGSGFFKNLKGQEIQGMYEQVGATNVFAVISTPMQELLKNRDGIRWQLILLGFGVALVGAALFAFMDPSDSAKGNKAIQAAANAGAPKGPQSVSTVKIPTPRLADGMADRSAVSASARIAASISHELRNPLTSILGHVQLAKAHTSDSKALEHLVRLENEARQAREIVQKLLIFSGEDKYKTEKASLGVSVQKALKAVEGRALSKGVKISKDLQTVPDFTFSPELISRGVESVLVNAIEAMERVPKKELIVKLVKDGEQVVLTIEDSGEGIDAANMQKIFEPFFTTRANAGHVGLGLSTAMGIVKETQGEMNVRSEKGKGTVVEMRFSPSATATPTATNDTVTASIVPAAAATSAPAPVQTVTAAPKVEKPLEFLVEKPAVPSLLVDKSVENLIDEDPLADKKLEEREAKKLPPTPADEFEPTMILENVSAAPPSLPPTAEPQKISEPAVLEKTEPSVLVKSEPAVLAKSEPAVLERTEPAVLERTEPAVLERTEPAVLAGLDEKQFSSKIDKPKLDLKKKTNKLDQVHVAGRRPGERV
jgi:signal transduction histidine kinase